MKGKSVTEGLIGETGGGGDDGKVNEGRLIKYR